MNVLSLFSGCGGMDLGFEGNFNVHRKSVNKKIHNDWAVSDTDSDDWLQLPPTGFRTIFSNDILRSAKAAWVPFFAKRDQYNVKHQFVLDSIVNIVKMKQSGNFEFPKGIDVVTGGFPCQDFSVAGKRKGFQSKKSHNISKLSDINPPTSENRGMLYSWMREVVKITKPKVFVAENVKGLVSLSNVKEIIEHDFSSIGEGYIVIPAKVLSAYEYGVPQSRQRVIFIGLSAEALTKEAKEAFNKEVIPSSYDPYPPKTHYLSKTNELPLFGDNECLLPHVSAGEVLSDLTEPHLSDDLSHQSYSCAKWMGRHCQGQTEIKPLLPGPTIRAEHHGNIEFRRLSKENGGAILSELNQGLSERRLSVRECARIQTFPDQFEFVRQSDDPSLRLSASDGYKLIGNAVPPLLAYHIAMRLKKNWNLYFGGRK